MGTVGMVGGTESEASDSTQVGVTLGPFSKFTSGGFRRGSGRSVLFCHPRSLSRPLSVCLSVVFAGFGTVS